MKKTFYSLSIFLAFCNLAFGQVSITFEDFPREVVFIDSVYSSILPQAYSLPSEGENQAWDYSDVVNTNLLEIEYMDASSDANFPNAFNKSELSLSFQGFPIEGYEYDILNENGWYLNGRHSDPVAYNISTISGGADDTLFFPENIDVYSDDVKYLEFPVEYQSSWSGTRIQTTPYELTVAAFGLQNTPGEQRRAWTDSRSVVGYGKIIIPDDNNNPSNEMDVLLIKSEVTTVDSFFIMGDPAPPALLNAFSLTQGNTITSSAYLFYMPNYGNPVLRVGVNQDGTAPASVAYRKEATRLNPTSLTEVDLNNSLGVYPNPVNVGQAVTINFNALLDNAEIFITDISGRTVHHNSINTPLESTKLNIPALASGVYILNVSAQNGTLIKSSKVLIH